jgi:hypothetical protein
MLSKHAVWIALCFAAGLALAGCRSGRAPVPAVAPPTARETTPVGEEPEKPAREEPPDIPLGAEDGSVAWVVEGWANPGRVAVVGDAVLVLTPRPGEAGKWALTAPVKLDFSQRRTLTVRLKTPVDVGLALALWTGEGREMFETRPQPVKGGNAWREVTFDVQGKELKSQASGWEFTAAARNLENVVAVSFLVYGTVAEPVSLRLGPAAE